MKSADFSEPMFVSPSDREDSCASPHHHRLLYTSSLYREFMAQRNEILKHKWIESEKAGYDIGFERALVNWMVNHHADWRRWRQACRKTGMASCEEGMLN